MLKFGFHTTVKIGQMQALLDFNSRHREVGFKLSPTIKST